MRKQRLNVSAVLVGDRYRQHLGDLAALTRSMANDGQRQPIVVLDDHTLLAGERRLEAARQLGWSTIDVYTVRTLADAIDALKADAASAVGDESVPLKVSERVAQAEPLHALHERERQPPQKALSRTQRHNQSVEALVANALGIGSTKYRAIRMAVLIARGQRPRSGRPVSDLDRRLAREAVELIDAGVGTEVVGNRLRAQLGYTHNSGIPTQPTDPDRVPVMFSRASLSRPAVRRAPLLDQLNTALDQLTKVANRLTKLAKDDRWPAYRNNVAPATRVTFDEAVRQIVAVQRQVQPPDATKGTP